MSRRIVKLPSLGNVAAGNTATLGLPVGPRKYFTLQLKYKDGTPNQATIEADLTKFRLLVNGKVQREFTAAELHKINALNGRAFQVGRVQIFLGEPWRRTITGEEIPGWGTFGLSTLQLEIDIAAGAVAPTLEARAEIEDSTEALGAIVKWKRFNYAAAGAGDFDITNLPKSDAWSRLHIFTAQASAAVLKADNVDIFDMSLTDATAFYASKTSLTMQANVLSVVLDSSQQFDAFLPMTRKIAGREIAVQDLLLRVTLGAAANFVVIGEQVGLPD